MENPVDIVTVTIKAKFDPEKINEEKIEALVQENIAKLKEATLDSCEINEKNSIGIVISIPKAIFEKQGPSDIKEIKEFISLFGPIFLIKIPIKIESVSVRPS